MPSRRQICTGLVGLGAAGAVGYVGNVITPTIAEPPPNTAPKGDAQWRFGFIGDTQLGWDIYPRLFDQLVAAGVEFVLHLGDLVDDAANRPEWNQLLEAAQQRGLCLKPVVGNHDCHRSSGDRGERAFQEYFPELPGTCYHFRHRELNFLMLNSEVSFSSGSAQEQWWRSTVAAVTGPMIVCLHRPVFTCGCRDWPRQWLRRFWVHGRLIEQEVLAVLSGHHHYYERTRPLDGVTYVVSGGGSPKLHRPEPPAALTARFQAGVNHCGIVDVSADGLLGRVVSLDGDELDRFMIPRELVLRGRC